jgi:hypothetical protein
MTDKETMVVEDLLVERFEYFLTCSGLPVPAGFVARQAIREIMGELVARLESAGESAAVAIAALQADADQDINKHALSASLVTSKKESQRMTKEEWLANANTPLSELMERGEVFHPNLTVEDTLVLALETSLHYSEAPALGKPVARQAVREVMGELITWLKAHNGLDAAAAIEAALTKKGDGSGDGDKTPSPNP